MASEDKSPVVRLYLASALQRVEMETRWKIAAELVKHGEDTEDHNLPKMIWFGLEPLVKENPRRALELAAQSQIPMVAQYIARRAVDANAIETLVTAIGKMPKTQVSLLEGMRDGLEGRYDLTAPANWAGVYAKLQQSEMKTVAELAQELAQQFGDTEAAQQSLAYSEK